MPLVLADRVRETTTTTGTGTISLAGPVSGFQGFSTAIGNANTTYYTIVDAATGAWEVGLGTYTSSGSTLARTTVLSSSNSDALVPFASGVKDVFVTQPAERAVYVLGAGTGLAAGAAAFTANGVPYASATNTLTTGSALTFDGTNLTQTAGTPVFTVFESASGNNNRLILTQNSGLTTYNITYSTATTNGHVFQIGGGEQMRLTSTGLGIGLTPNALFKLDVNGNARISSAGAQGLEVQPGAVTYLLAYNRTTSVYTPLDLSGEYLRFSTNNGSERMRITAAGDVGIGTISPGQKLTVAGTQRIQKENAGYEAAMLSFSTLSETGAIYRMGMATGGVFAIGRSDTSTTDLTLNQSGNLGIGTVSPAQKLVVSNAGAAGFEFDPANAIIQTYNRSSGAYIDMRQYALNIRFFTGSSPTETMRIDSSGNLGLGVTPSAWESTAKAFQFGSLGYVARGSSGQTMLGYNNYLNTSNQYIYSATSQASRYEQISGEHRWFTAPSGTAGNAISFTQAMTLDASGNLGVGATLPLAKLDVVGGNGDGIQYRTSTRTVGIGQVASEAAVYWGSTTALTFFSGSERARIDSSGNLGIGTTNPLQKLVVSNAGAQGLEISPDAVASAPVLIAYNRSGSGYVQLSAIALQHVWQSGASPTERARITSEGDLLVGTTSSAINSSPGIKLNPAQSGANAPTLGVVTAASTNTTVSFSAYSTGAGAYRFYVDNAGTIFATSTAISAISDQRLKENIQDLDAGLDKIMALKPRKFDWKAGKGKDIKDDRGFIAQEFEQVFPEMIDNWKDPAPEGEEPYKSVRADLIPVLVKAIQELKAEFDAYKAIHP